MKRLGEGSTPGPWKAYTFPPERGISHYVVAGIQDQISICMTGRFDLASAADARLISKAYLIPEMAETLQDFVDNGGCFCLSKAQPEPPGEHTSPCSWCDAKALLTKLEAE